jgi:four helix bundle protein
MPLAVLEVVPSVADLLERRIDQFTVRALRFVRTLPRGPVPEVLARQLARALCGFADNRRSARRGRSRAEFISRLAISLDEIDEVCKWLERLKATGCSSGDELEWLIGESAELRAITAASLATARRRKQPPAH